MTAKTKTETMFALVDRWKTSGVTQKQFCTEHELKVGTFAYWVAKHKQANSGEPVSGFVDIDVYEPAGSASVHITYPNGVVLSCLADPILIGQLIRLT